MNQLDGKPTKKNLETVLKNCMKGVSRPPALSFGDITEPLQQLNLSQNEVSQVEPLHDLKGHIKNHGNYFLNMFLKQLKKFSKTKLKLHLAPLRTHRGCDYRLSVILVCQRLKDQVSKEVDELLYTLKEIARLAYLNSEERTPKSVLRLYNMTYLHALRCVQLFGLNPKLRKIYGTYYHAIVTHLPEHSRIIAPSSLHTESEERIFNSLRGIGRDTTDRLQTSVRDVGIVR